MLLTFAAAGLCFGSARADLPVHCLRHQIAGDWDFHLGPLSADRSSCGHLSPDSQDHQPKVALTQTVDVKQVSLENPNVVRTSSSEGHWTMIYDEGFEVNVDGLSFFAFSRFDLHNVGGVKTNVSRCGETQLGWYHDLDTGRWGCYFGRRRGDDSLHASLLAMAPARGRSSDSAPESNRDPKGPAYDEPLGSLHHDAFVAGLNLVQEAWSAKTYERLIGKSLRELNAMAGIFRPFRRDEQLAQQQAAGPHGAPSFLQTRQRASPEGRLRSALGSDAGKLPAAWDWRNVSGASYVDPLMDQGDCGSCYVVSTVHMLSSRHRIRQRDPTLDAFSIEFPLKCSEYTQGCDGGYAFLVSRWSQDVGLVPRSCGEYAGTAGSCSLRCSVGDLGKRWRADNHRYVGGYYGAAAEREMMRELVEGGPIVASFEPKPDFMYYSGGVYKSVPSQRMEWEQVDHAVLLVGYGEENGQKYWTLQNSWGRDWGEDGFFRMARGTDESGIESIVVAADVVEEGEKWSANYWVWNKPRDMRLKKRMPDMELEEGYEEDEEDEDEEDEGPVPAQHVRATVTFENSGADTVHLFWFNPSSNEEVALGDIPPNSDSTMNSFHGHTWHVRAGPDSSSKLLHKFVVGPKQDKRFVIGNAEL